MSFQLNDTSTKFKSWFKWFKEENYTAEDMADVRHAIKYIHKLIDDEVRDGIESKHIYVGGFSQGGALAIQSAMTYYQQLGGIIALSAWIPMVKTFMKTANPKNLNIPIFIGHGEKDAYVPYYLGKASAEVLKLATKKLVFKTYHNADHILPKEGMADITSFLKNLTTHHHNATMQYYQTSTSKAAEMAEEIRRLIKNKMENLEE